MNKRLKIFFAFLIVQVVCAFSPLLWKGKNAFAQTLIGTTGNYSTAPFGSISSSVGEAMITTTPLNGGIQLTQGFQQTFSPPCPGSTGAFSVTPNSIVCEGGSVTIIPTFSPADPSYSYSWSSGQITSSIIVSPSVNTAYTFSVVGCSNTISTQSIIVNPSPPAPIASYNNPVCEGDTLSLSASPNGMAAYEWSSTNGFISSAQDTIITGATTAASGTYSVVATNTAGCTSTAGTVSVTVNPNPIPNISHTDVPCNSPPCNGTATVSPTLGTQPYTYSWSGPSPTFSAVTQGINNLCPGSYTVIVTDAFGCNATAVDIIRPQLFTNISKIDSLCCKGVVRSTPFGTGMPPYSFSWAGPSGTATTQIISGLCPGTYSVTVTDGAGCVKTDSIKIIQSSFVTIDTFFTATICGGETTTIGVLATGNNLSYNWSPTNPPLPSDSIISVSPINTTLYSATVQSGSCTLSVPILVTVNPTPTVTIGGLNTVCSGNSTTLTASVSAGSPSFTLDWLPSGPFNNPIFANPPLSPPTTSYSVVVTNDSGCVDTASILIQIISTPTITINASPPGPVCAGSPVTLTASGGLPSYTYQWNASANTDSIIVETPVGPSQVYVVNVTNASCSVTATTTVNVTSITASISGNTSACVGGSGTFTATSTGGNPPFTYSWTGPSLAATTSNVTTPIYTTPAPHVYSVTITDGNGCSVIRTHTVSVFSPPVPGIAANPDTVICLGESVTLTASPPGAASYQWNNGTTTNSSMYLATPTTSGIVTYSVIVSNGNCSAGKTIKITVNPLPAVTASASKPVICPGDTVTLTASPPTATNYSWAPGTINGATVSVFPPSSTTYTVTATDANSCSNTATVPVTVSDISVNAGIDQTICPGYAAQLNASVSGSTTGINYHWMPGSFLNDSAISNPSASNLDTTTVFSVEVFNGDGCYDKDTLTVFVNFVQECLEICNNIYNGITPNGDGDNDVWFVNGITAFEENTVSIFNRWGGRVWQVSGYENKYIIWNGDNDQGEQLPSGTYYYVIDLNWKGRKIQCTGWVEITR